VISYTIWLLTICSVNGTVNGTRTPSGAYIFNPTGPPSPLFIRPQVTVINGPYVQEVFQVYNGTASQIIRLYPSKGDSIGDYTRDSIGDSMVSL
jgi:hypothetical protein